MDLILYLLFGYYDLQGYFFLIILFLFFFNWLASDTVRVLTSSGGGVSSTSFKSRVSA